MFLSVLMFQFEPKQPSASNVVPSCATMVLTKIISPSANQNQVNQVKLN